MRLAMAVMQEAWERENPTIRHLLSAFGTLHESSHRFLGAYSLFRQLALLYSPHNHGVSPTVFFETLKNMAELESAGHEISPQEFSETLGGVVAGGLAKNLDFRRAVREFTVNSVQCIVGLPSREVLELARKSPEPTSTYLGDARLLFEFIKKAAGNRGGKACERLSVDLSKIESAAG